jgi:inner membrane protein
MWHRWRATDSGAPPFRPGAILALAFLSVWSHPFLDWLNTYGVRWLMPFDGRWFYGDALFIIEPWLWLLMAAGVVMARSSTWRSITGWLLLAVLATALILATDIVPMWVKLVWCAGVLLIALLRWNAGRSHEGRWSPGNLARGGLLVLVAYIGVSFGFARADERRTAARFEGAEQVQSNPAPGNPFLHRLLVVQPDRYVILAEDGAVHELPRRPADAVVRAALEDDSIRGFANWLRYADWTVEEGAGHWVVRIRDLRYQGPDMTTLRDFGTATVTVPKPVADSD